MSLKFTRNTGSLKLLLKSKKLQVWLASLLFVALAVAVHRSIRITKMNDDRAWDLYEESLHEIKIGNVHNVEKLLKEAIDLSEVPNPTFYRSLGHHYLRSHRYSDAIRNYEKAIALDKKFEPSILYYLASCYAEQGRIFTALDFLNRLKRVYPKQYTQEADALVESIQRTMKRGPKSKRKKVLFRIQLPNIESRDFPLLLGGNWTAAGKQSDAYGYQYVPIHNESQVKVGNIVDLPESSDLPFQIVIKNKRNEPKGIARFLAVGGPDTTQVISITNVVPDAPFGPMNRRSVLEKPSSSSDQNRRIFILWWDCGSWWFVRPLIELGFMPNARDMFTLGSHGEMNSNPPWTAVAIRRITTFDETPNFFDRMLLQIKGIQFFDRFIPYHSGNQTLGGELKKAKISFVDLTFNQAYVDNPDDKSKDFGFKDSEDQVYVPDAGRFEIPEGSPVRKYMDIAKLEPFFSNLDPYGKMLMSTQWDDTERKLEFALQMFKDKVTKVMLVRLAGVDILSHYFFENKLSSAGRNQLLRAFYVYLDDKLGEVRSQLDSDDTLLLISDHGILNHYQHHPAAMFLAQGPSIPIGKALSPFEISRFPHIVKSLATESRLPSDIRVIPSPSP